MSAIHPSIHLSVCTPIYLPIQVSQSTSVFWVPCHFSPYAIGLSNLPDTLPESSIIILNDRMPIAGHDPNCIAQQLTQLSERTGAAGILLDLQRPDCQETAALVQALTKSISCPIAISPSYAVDNFPVFLPPFPINTP